MNQALKRDDVADARPADIKFAYWVPNVSGGLVISKIEQRTSWTLEYNTKLAQIAEQSGFDYALSQIRFTAGYGAEYQHESVAISHALIAATKKLNVIAALLPGPWHPALAAKQIATISQLYNGRVSVNIVSGWFRGEFAAIGLEWLDHDERYRRSEEFIRALRGIWTEDNFNFQRRLLSLPQLHAEAKAGLASAGNLPGRQFARGARHGLSRLGLVFHQREHRRRHQEAGRRHTRKGGGQRPQRQDRRQRLRDRARSPRRKPRRFWRKSSQRPTLKRSTPSVTRSRTPARLRPKAKATGRNRPSRISFSTMTDSAQT